MDLVDEDDVAGLQAGQQAGQISRLVDDGARRGLDVDAHGLAENEGQRRLAETRRPQQKHVIQGLLALPRRLDGQHEAVGHFPLTGELLEAGRPQVVVELRIPLVQGLVDPFHVRPIG